MGSWVSNLAERKISPGRPSTKAAIKSHLSRSVSLFLASQASSQMLYRGPLALETDVSTEREPI